MIEPVEQAERAYSQNLRGLNSRIDRLLASCDAGPKRFVAARVAALQHPVGEDSAPPSNARPAGFALDVGQCGGGGLEPSRRGWKAKQGATAVQLQSQAGRKISTSKEAKETELCGRSRSDPGDDLGMQATLDVYHIAQNGLPYSTHHEASSLISKSQQLAEQFFGVPTQYVVRHGAETLRQVDAVHSDEEENCNGSSDVSGFTLVKAIVPRLCFDFDAEEHGGRRQVSTRKHVRPQSARFAPSVPKSSNLRPESARLGQITRQITPISYLHSAPENPSLFIEYRDHESASQRMPRMRGQSARSRLFHNSIASGHALLQKGRVEPDEPLNVGIVTSTSGKVSIASTATLPRHRQRPTSDACQDGENADGLDINVYRKNSVAEQIEVRNLRTGASAKGRSNLHKDEIGNRHPIRQRDLTFRPRHQKPPIRRQLRQPSKPKTLTPRRLPSPTLLEEMSATGEQESEFPMASASARQGNSDAHLSHAQVRHLPFWSALHMIDDNFADEGCSTVILNFLCLWMAQAGETETRCSGHHQVSHRSNFCVPFFLCSSAGDLTQCLWT